MMAVELRAFACLFLCLDARDVRPAEREFRRANVDKTGHLDQRYFGGGEGGVRLARESYDTPLVLQTFRWSQPVP